MNRIITLIGIAIVAAISFTACDSSSSQPQVNVVERYLSAIERGDIDEAEELVHFSSPGGWPPSQWRCVASHVAATLDDYEPEIAFEVLPLADLSRDRVEVRWTSGDISEIDVVHLDYSGILWELERGVTTEESWKVDYGGARGWETFPDFLARNKYLVDCR